MRIAIDGNHFLDATYLATRPTAIRIPATMSRKEPTMTDEKRLDQVDEMIGEIQKTINGIRETIGNNVPLPRFVFLARSALNLQEWLIDQLLDDPTPEMELAIMHGLMRLRDLDYFGNSFDDLCDLANSAGGN